MTALTTKQSATLAALTFYGSDDGTRIAADTTQTKSNARRTLRKLVELGYVIEHENGMFAKPQPKPKTVGKRSGNTATAPGSMKMQMQNFTKGETTLGRSWADAHVVLTDGTTLKGTREVNRAKTVLFCMPDGEWRKVFHNRETTDYNVLEDDKGMMVVEFHA